MQENATMYCREDGSDKVYSVQLVETDNGWVVNYQNGPRLGTKTNKTKTAVPVDYAEAKKIYDKVIKDRIKNKYSFGEDGTAYSGTILEQRATGQKPQLLNVVDESRLEELFTSPDWYMEPKYDGQRRPLRKTAEGFVGSSKLGIEVSLPMSVVNTLSKIPHPINLDGEEIGDDYFVYDCLEIGDEDLRGLSYRQRRERLAEVFAAMGDTPNVFLGEIAKTEAEKRAMFEKVKDTIGEGVVFKKHAEAHKPGRPASGGPQLKFKFFKDATVIVTKLNKGKRSVGIALLDEEGKLVPMGNVTIPTNVEIPAVRALMELKYQKVARGGALFIPIYQYIRTDVRYEDCVMTQLVYSLSGDDDDDA